MQQTKSETSKADCLKLVYARDKKSLHLRKKDTERGGEGIVCVLSEFEVEVRYVN